MKIIRKYEVITDDGKKHEFDNFDEADRLLLKQTKGLSEIYEWRGFWHKLDVDEFVEHMKELENKT